jgi:hypothetical protein
LRRKTPATTTRIRALSDHEEDRWFPVGTFLPLWAHDGVRSYYATRHHARFRMCRQPIWGYPSGAETPVNAGRLLAGIRPGHQSDGQSPTLLPVHTATFPNPRPH